MSKAEKLACADKLEAAALVIQVPGWWTQGAEARTSGGFRTLHANPEARRFCMLGAYMAAGGGVFDLGYAKMRELVGGTGPVPVSAWNDAPGRTAQEVASLMLDAADQLRGEAV